MSCIEPPVPPNETRLIRHYEGGQTIDFGAVANYTCQPGYYFESDFHKERINVTCYDTGSWELPAVWERCYQPSERTCFDPPAPAFNGGKYNWNKAVFEGGKTPYLTQVIYSCELGRKLHKYMANETLVYDNKTLTCQWNRTYTPVGPV